MSALGGRLGTGFGMDATLAGAGVSSSSAEAEYRQLTQFIGFG